MCLAIPGKIISLLNENDSLERTARVDFSGVSKEISLAYLPEAKLNDYVIVHAGLALSILDEAEAVATLAAFAELDAINQTELPS
jgi:hydrogenase expression/formation protein HypC